MVKLRDNRIVDLPEVKAKRLIRKGWAVSATKQPQERAMMPRAESR